MTPDEYEIFVAEYFTKQGYNASKTQASNDYGVDVFASKGKEKIAIQAKMYGGTNRPVNRQMIMELHGAKDYFDCTKAVLVTDGRIIANAQDVANKLNIEILNLMVNNNQPRTSSESTSFDLIWSEHVKSLEGTTIVRENGKTNKILIVDSSGVERITSNGKKQRIDIEIFRSTINHIITKGSITRKEINEEYSKRASSGIVLILSQLPMFELSNSRPKTLQYVEGMI